MNQSHHSPAADENEFELFGRDVDQCGFGKNFEEPEYRCKLEGDGDDEHEEEEDKKARGA